MKKPKFIFFDYGGTLLQEPNFDKEKGFYAILQYAKSNPYNVTAQDLANFDTMLNNVLGRFSSDKTKYQFEIHNSHCSKLIYEYYDLTFDLSFEELELIFWENASLCIQTPNIENLLNYLKNSRINTAIISNISYSEVNMKKKIQKYLPNNDFKFILNSSEYIFRKPNSIIFEIALKKANILPNEAIFCGNDFYYDVIGAHNANIYPVLYTALSKNNQTTEHSFDYLTITDWNELIEFIEKCED